MKTHISIIVDESGSMDHLAKDVKRYLNSLLKQTAKESPAGSVVSLYAFSSHANVIFSAVQTKNMKERDVDIDYSPQGLTALWDGVGLAIENMVKDADTYLFYVITDGLENCSFNWNKNKIATKLKELQMHGNCTFVFQVPDVASKNTLLGFGLYSDNIQVWNNTSEGLKTASVNTSAGLKTYFNSVSRGVTSVSNFYQATATNLNANLLKKNLDDVSKQYSIYDVKSEIQIRPFVEKVTGKKYTKGQAFYRLEKPELVQENKVIVIHDKKNSKLYEGDDARGLIGIGKNRAKVYPDNHSLLYDIYIKSTSVNRKLPKGTKVLVQK